MHRRMTITLDEGGYEGVYRTVGKRRMSEFIEDVLRPQVGDTSLDDGYRGRARVVVVPVTSNTGRQYPGETVVTVGGQSSNATAAQIMAADKARLKNQIGTLSK